MQLVTVLCCVSVFFWLLAESRHAGENGLEEVFEQDMNFVFGEETENYDVDAMSCDCDYHKSGCTISDKAPPGLACKCKYQGFWTCKGEVTHCEDDNNYYCKHPDRSYQSCKQGNGDCGGYRLSVKPEVNSKLGEETEDRDVEAMSCDCDYHKGGCTISDKAPPGLACKCKYQGFWTCKGEVTHCEDDNNYYCKHPDRSYQSCKQGNGDCGGYRLSVKPEVNSKLGEETEDRDVEAMSCDCDYHKGGCTISDKAPPGLACKCKYQGFWTCSGEVTHCEDDNNYYCKHPDRSYQSCKQGNGDCGGYRLF